MTDPEDFSKFHDGNGHVVPAEFYFVSFLSVLSEFAGVTTST